jgi:hypothetical protein
MTRGTLLLVAIVLGSAQAAAETVEIEADRDATLIEDPDGALANGSGIAFFAGRTNLAENSIRRALLRFDVAAVVPRQAIVESVALRLYLNPSNAAPRTIGLYRALADWGEGPSSSAGGGGAPSERGDATWLHTFWDSEFWAYAGGQFIGRASAEAEVSDTGYFTWEAGFLSQDVRLWLAAPQQNFGWFVLGDETTRQTAKGFASREEPDPTRRPVLTITYRVPRPS